MTPQPGQQIITVHILPNTSRSKDNDVNTLRDIFFFKNYAESNAGRLIPDLFLFFKKPNTR